MKKGDIVTVNDFSWCVQINECERNCKKQYVVVDIGCYFSLNDGQPRIYRNDTVIQAKDGNDVILIYEAFLKPILPTHKVMVDIRQDNGWMYGEVVEISDKLYKEIKRGS